MARSRNIKPGFYKNEDLAECSIWARFIFPGLWQLADRAGLLEDRPKRIKAELLPFDTVDVEPLLTELHARKFIVRYRNSEGSFIFIPGFSTHQSPHYSEKASGIKPPRLPDKGGYQEPPSPREAPEESRSTPDNSRSTPAIKSGSQPPDSLIPDSLIPESTQAASKDRTLEAPQPPAAEAGQTHPNLAAQIFAMCDRASIVIDATTATTWAQGATLVQVAKAIEIARSPGRKPLPQSITAAYVRPILRDLVKADLKAKRAADRRHDATKAKIAEQRATVAAPMPEKLKPKRRAYVPAEPVAVPQPTRAREPEPDDPGSAGTASLDEDRSTPADLGEGLPDNPYAEESALPDAGEELVLEDEPRWWEHPDRVMARAVELQVQVFDGEGFEDLTARVLAAMGPGPHTAELDPAFQERVQYFAAVGVNSDAARPQAN